MFAGLGNEKVSGKVRVLISNPTIFAKMKLQVVLVLALLATAALALSAEPKEQGSLHPVKVLQSGSNGACDCNPSDENCGCKPKWQVPEIKEEKACPCSDEEKAQAECECLKKQANEHPLDKKEHYLPPNNVVEGDEQVRVAVGRGCGSG